MGTPAKEPALKDLVFIDNPGMGSRRDHYETVTVDVDKILKSWRESLFSYEWVQPDGRLKTIAELPAAEQPKRQAVEDKIKRRTPLERPILGIGLLENVEIGSGRATFLTLASHGIKTIEVHIPASNRYEFLPFMIET